MVDYVRVLGKCDVCYYRTPREYHHYHQLLLLLWLMLLPLYCYFWHFPPIVIWGF